MSKEERDFLQSAAANRPYKASAVEVEFGRAVTMRIPRSAGIRVLCFMVFVATSVEFYGQWRALEAGTSNLCPISVEQS
jgi:hypothetical protein